MKKLMQSRAFPVRTLLKLIPAELACYGFEISDFDISFRKGQSQIGLYYKDVEQPPKNICENFQKNLREMPMNIMNQINEATLMANQQMKEYKAKDAVAEAKNDKQEDTFKLNDEL